jgi:hypothetical protein
MKSSPAKFWPWGKKPKKKKEFTVQRGGEGLGLTSVTDKTTSYRRDKKDEKNRVKKTVVDFHRGPREDESGNVFQPETHTRTTTKYDRKGNVKKSKVKDISVGTRKGFLGLGGKRK